ncbi:transposable element Tcb1 transposase [Trichonephila clavipes]|nr:transposable element Tcb1 transposase [Trichonephila clavipes]
MTTPSVKDLSGNVEICASMEEIEVEEQCESIDINEGGPNSKDQLPSSTTTNFDYIELLIKVSRHQKGLKEKSQILQPNTIHQCNKNMGEVDHQDWLLEKHTIQIRGKKMVDRLESSVRNCWEQWTQEGTHARKTGSGATRNNTRREDRRIMRQAPVDRTVTRSTIRADVGVAIVLQTISRHLAESNLKSKCPFRALPLTPEHRQLCLQWLKARLMWNVTDWQKAVFSDESRFVLGIDDNRVRVWRRPGERYNLPQTVLRHTARTAGVMVWGAIAYDSRSTLIVMCGTLTGQRYVDDILRPHVGPFLNGLPVAILNQDNARPHTARVVQDYLRHFQTLPWPAHYPICALLSTCGIS